jgi:hypothetical protein
MGGQACVFYGAAEFSRDADLVVLASAENLAALQAALDQLKAERIAVPPFEQRFLDMGLAIHFRCLAEGTDRLRIDVMSKLRGVEDFETLWNRRSTVETEGVVIDMLALPDLVKAKKTQRDKDWPMISRLLEADYAAMQSDLSAERLRFWFCEMRSCEILIGLAAAHPATCKAMEATRPLLRSALARDERALRASLRNEEEEERERDRQYWAPLKRELEILRAAEKRKSKGV